MFQSKLKLSNIRSALLLGAASAAALGLTAPAKADSVETVVVTGSRIPQQGLYSSSPVTTVGQQEIQLEGTTSVETLISNLPSAVTDQNNFQANGATGIATVNLRGLGSTRTLVLIDGKRLLPGDPIVPVPDLNNIPAALVDHVEVLTGGASATYGSDAVAGVVNFIMRKDFEGIELDGEYSINEDSNDHYPNFSAATASQGFATAKHNIWDGGTVDATLIMGANSSNGRGNVTAYLGYRDIKAVWESARDFSACSAEDVSTYYKLYGLDAYKNFICAGSSNIYAGRFNSLDEGGVASTYSTNPDQTDPSLPDSMIPRGNATTPGTLCYNHVSLCSFNYAPFNYLQRPDTRYTGGMFAHYQVDKMLDAYSSLMFTDDHTVAQIAASGLFAGSGPAVGAYTFNCDNPYLGPHTLGLNNAWDLYCYNYDTDEARTGDATALIGRRFAINPLTGSGANLNRQDDLRHTTYRMLIGAKGDLGDGWSYDASAQYATAIFGEEYFNDVSSSRVEKALHVIADPRTEILGAPNPNFGLPVCESVIDGTDPNCVPLNIFQFGAATQDALSYAGGNGMKQGSTTEQVITVNLTGDLGSMGGQFPWAKSPVALAVGAEYRQEGLDFRPDYEIQTGDLAGQGGPSPRVHGRYHVSEFYGEVRVPIVQDQEFFEDLTVNGKYRYSDYSTVGSVSTYSYGAEWQPIDDIRFRGSFARAVRAPNILELYTPQFIGLYSGLDPCSGSGLYYSVSPLTAAQCARTGVTNSQYNNESIQACPAAQCSALFGGNPNLKPESSDTKSYGIVLTPTFITGFTATVDYFDIKVDKAIGTYGPNTAIAVCAGDGMLGADTLFPSSVSSTYCDLIHRAPISGVLFGTSGYVDQRTVNTGSLQTKGWDFEANYQSELSDLGMGDGLGSIGVHFIGTLVSDYIVTPGSGDYNIGSYNCKGLYGVICGTGPFGGPVPEWRHTLRFTWSTPWDIDLSVAWRHVSGVSFDGNDSSQPLLAYINRYVSCATLSGDVTCDDVLSSHIKAYNYIDLAGSWTVAEGVQIRAGVNNVFDKAPPLLDGVVWGIGFNANTYPGAYDTLGRNFFISGTLKF